MCIERKLNKIVVNQRIKDTAGLPRDVALLW